MAVLINDRLAGVFILRDKVRSDSKKALEELKKTWSLSQLMLTGDNRRTAEAVAKRSWLNWQSYLNS